MPDTTDADANLSRILDALASPTRIAILRELRTPKTLSEIQVRTPDRTGALARQTVRQHLDRLTACDLVVGREAVRDYGATTEFVLSHRAVYGLAEEVRALARMRSAVEIDGDTLSQAQQPGRRPTGPALVVAKGLDEGAIFPLAEGRDTWVLGRSRACDIVLDFDPFVSAENAVVKRSGDGFLIEDIEGSRNGTRVNFSPLRRGGNAPLHHGDILGLGCSLLVHWQ